MVRLGDTGYEKFKQLSREISFLKGKAIYEVFLVEITFLHEFIYHYTFYNQSTVIKCLEVMKKIGECFLFVSEFKYKFFIFHRNIPDLFVKID